MCAMANQEHLALLNQGGELWNEWRKKYPEIRPDLRSANLVSAEMSGIQFSDTDLQGARLTWANLSHAQFSHANLSDADCSRTDLSHTNFNGAILVRADLRWASL